MGKLFSIWTLLVLMFCRPALPQLNLPAKPGPSELNDLTLSTESVSATRFVAAHGQRSAIFGYPGQGLEVWAWPFQILDGYHVGFVPEGAATEIPGEQILRRIDYRPQSVTRIYTGPDFIVRETLFVPIDKPAAIVSYEVLGRGKVNLRVRFTPQMNLMWPAAVGGQSTEWSAQLHGYVLRDTTNGYVATASSSDITDHDATENSTIRSGEGLEMVLHPTPTGANAASARLVVVMDAQHSAALGEAAADLLANAQSYEQQAVAHYTELRNRVLQVITPDEDVNRALAWSEIALDQAWVCNPQLGCGEVAGYGPSRPGRRPQYAWFFADDGVVDEEGLLAAGEYQRAREELDFILRYQNKQTGMIWHELSQSASFLDWEHKYPYMFVHVEVTFQFLSAVADYVEASGDVDFARRHWDALQLAYRYCRSILDPVTKLPRIAADKEGSNEQVRESDELSLSATWLDASDAFSRLAAWTTHAAEAADAKQAKEIAAQAIAARYWDESRQFWISGHTVDGTEIFDQSSQPSELLTARVFTPRQNNLILDRIASSDFETDWGTRGLSSATPDFDPNAYAHGSIFALSAARTAQTFWEAHRPATAFAIWDAVVPWTSLDSLGHIHEVAAGDFYHQEMESVPEQTWSSAALLSSAVNGWLGLKVSGMNHTLKLAPHLPPAWDHVAVRNLSVGKARLALELSEQEEKVSVTVMNEGDAVAVVFDPQIPLGAEDLHASCGGETGQVVKEKNDQDQHVRIGFTATPGKTQCSLAFRGGVSLLVPVTEPRVGDPSYGLKVTDVRLNGRVLTVAADVHPAGPAFVEIQTPWVPVSADGGSLSPVGEDRYRITFNESRTSHASAYLHSAVRIHFQ